MHVLKYDGFFTYGLFVCESRISHTFCFNTLYTNTILGAMKRSRKSVNESLFLSRHLSIKGNLSDKLWRKLIHQTVHCKDRTSPGEGMIRNISEGTHKQVNL